jgi:RNA polymerase sigma factor (sigma-70 family)
VGRGPGIVAEPSDDQRLVAAIRRGDDRAFEALYERYHRRIHAYIMGMVKDHGRAEDITQEVFVSALRRMRETERPIAFKPWVYEIAKNACIDQFRRSRRAEEVSLEADEGLAPSDYGRLVGSDPTPDVAVAAKQDLDHLCGAFGGLSDTHHEILVLRELEGLSYREIGDRLAMSRPAVESTLFRARRRLTEEYDELVSGARCQRIQSLIAMARQSRLGTRESRRLSRHVSHCQPCRREAIAAGLDSAILTHVPLRRRAAEKVAALLPFGWFGRGRGGDDTGAGASLTSSSGGGRWATNVPMLSEQLQGGWGKVATAAAVVVAGVGAAGVGTQVVGGADDVPRGGDRPAAVKRTASPAGPGGATTTRATLGSATTDTATKADRRSRKGDRTRGGATEGGDGAGSSVPAGLGGSGANGASSDGGGGGGGAAGGVAKGLPEVELPVQGQNPIAPVTETVERVVETIPPVVEQVTGPVEQVTGPVEEVTAPVQEVVDGVDKTVGEVGKTVDGATNGLLP